MTWYLLIPFIILAVALLLLGIVFVLGRVAGGRYLRAIVTRVPFLQRLFERMSISALERSNPELANAMKKMQTFGTPSTPEQAQRALNLLTPSERRAYMEAVGDQAQGQGPEPTNRQQRRRLERSALPGGGKAPQRQPRGNKGKRKK